MGKSPSTHPPAPTPTVRPGAPAPASGLYREVGPRGGNVGRQVTVPENRTMPPTTAPGRQYRLEQPADNKSGKGK